jgi:preprotein translocase subunit SecE
MKALNKISQIAAVVFGLGAIVMFFLPFVDVFSKGELAGSYIAAQWAFGSKVEFLGESVKLAMSAKILFTFILTAFAAVLSIVGLFVNKKGIRYTVSAVSLFTAIYTLVCVLGKITRFVDVRPIDPVSSVHYTWFAIIMVVAMFVFAAFAITNLFVDDYIEAKANGGKTIAQRVVHFFRDYKSEVKKIVWPGLNEVIRNTIIVLIMCAVVGVLIWLVDFGLGNLIELILNSVK